MGTTTTRYGLHKPDGTDPRSQHDDDHRLDYEIIDQALGFFPCTSTTRPSSPQNGRTIRETDTGKAYVYTGTEWVQIPLGSSGGAVEFDSVEADEVAVAGLSLPRGIVAWGRRTTSSTPTTASSNATAALVLRLSDVALKAGRLYRISAPMVNCIATAPGRTQVSMYGSTTGNATATSTLITEGSVALPNPDYTSSVSIETYRTPTVDETFSVVLAIWRIVGTGGHFVYAAPTIPMHMVVEDMGAVIAHTGVAL